MSGATGTQPVPVNPGTNILQPWTQAQLNASSVASTQIRAIGQRFTQQIAVGSFTPVNGTPTIITPPINNVGLITKFFVFVTTTVTNPGGGATLTRSPFGPFNTFSSIQYTDPNTNARISTTGYHLATVTARRHRRIPGAALSTDSPTGFGSVIQPIACPNSIAAGDTGTVSCMYEIPLSIGRQSLKGSVFAGAVFATQSLQLTFNPLFATASGSDPLPPVFTGAAAAPNGPTLQTSYIVWQEFWDQFPLSLLQNLSPDLSTVYEIKTTAFSALIQGNDNFIRFTNLRSFMSTMVAFDNGGVLNAGTDINYFKLQSANQTTEWQRNAQLQSYLTRNGFGDDMPIGTYLFDFSESPIITAAEGNTVLIVNPSTVNANAVLQVGWEDLATSTVLASAPSLAGNASAA